MKDSWPLAPSVRYPSLLCVMVAVPGRFRLFAAFALTAVAACSEPPVRWDDARSVTSGAVHNSLIPGGSVAEDPLAGIAARVQVPGGACPGSVRLSRSGRKLHAAWWVARPDSSVKLLSAHSPDEGGSWSAPVNVDSTDRGVTGCRRDPPAIAADSVSGYVHVTYGMVAAEGPGLFFSHSMNGGGMFHAPVPIMYGERLGRTSVAADGDLVAVGFEDPNSRAPRVGLAISRTMGHIFDERILPVSTDNGVAAGPLTAVQGRRVTVAWQNSIDRPGRATFRILAGTLH